MKIITTKNAPQAIGPYSQAVEANGMIYTSGQIGLTPEGVFAAADVANKLSRVIQILTHVSIIIFGCNYSLCCPIAWGAFFVVFILLICLLLL